MEVSDVKCVIARLTCNSFFRILILSSDSHSGVSYSPFCVCVCVCVCVCM